MREGPGVDAVHALPEALVADPMVAWECGPVRVHPDDVRFLRYDQYKDEVRGRIMEMIDRKVEGEDISVAPAEQAETKIIDIMEALKASLAAGETKRKPARRAGKKTAARKKASRKKGAS